MFVLQNLSETEGEMTDGGEETNLRRLVVHYRLNKETLE
jgi:hypothetical protein